MRFSIDNLISLQSCKRARLQRLIQSEEDRIKKLNSMLEHQECQQIRQRWIEARRRLRDLRAELFKLDLQCDWW